MTRFSVIVATHRRPRLLSRAIQSVKVQMVPDVQIIVVSDADCPETRGIANQSLSGSDLFVQRYGGRPGPAESRNLGLKLAGGDWFLFLDDDDAFAPGYFAEIAKHATSERILYSNYHVAKEVLTDDVSTVVDITEVNLQALPTSVLYVKNFIPIHCAVYPGSLASRLSFDASLDYEDWEFVLHASTMLPMTHLDIFGPVVFHRDEVSRSQASDPYLEATYRKVYAKYPAPDPAVASARNELFRVSGLGRVENVETPAAGRLRQVA